MKNQLAEQFQMLNGHIASAILDKDYTRAITLDRARQDMLKDICLMDMQSIDAEFFALIEECARDNASLIQIVQKDEPYQLANQPITAGPARLFELIHRCAHWLVNALTQILFDRFFSIINFFSFFQLTSCA